MDKYLPKYPLLNVAYSLNLLTDIEYVDTH